MRNTLDEISQWLESFVLLNHLALELSEVGPQVYEVFAHNLSVIVCKSYLWHLLPETSLDERTEGVLREVQIYCQLLIPLYHLVFSKELLELKSIVVF